MKGMNIMALTDADLEGFTLGTEVKPERTGVTISQIPPVLVTLLESEAPKALKDPKQHRVVIRVPVRVEEPKPLAKDANPAAVEAHAEAVEAHAKALETAMGVVKQLQLYATAWGKGQDPKLYLTKLPSPKEERALPVVYMRVEMDEGANKRGRAAH